MRANLVELYGKEIVVKGKYKSYAVTSGYRNYLFTHIMYNGVEITGHMWIRLPNDVGRSLKKKKEYEFDNNKKIKKRIYIVTFLKKMKQTSYILK